MIRVYKNRGIQVLITVFSFCLSIQSGAQSLDEKSDSVRYNSQIFDAVSIDYDVKYGHAVSQGGEGQDLLMDIYYPTNDTLENRPLIIFAHGGYFLFGDKAGFAEECQFFAESGYVVATINYRLIDLDQTEEVSKRAVIDAVNDQKAAVRFFYKDFNKKNEYKIDPSQIFIGGYSAGAVSSLHYAYANTPEDVMKMGGKELLDYVIDNGGIEGQSGNQGYSSKIKGVINMAGSIHSVVLLNKNEPILISIHGDSDIVVPYLSGTTGETDVVTEGSGLIHQKAEEIGLINQLITVQGGEHDARFYCDHCLTQVRQFVFDNL
ncbi:MAG: carboxylesterase family protein [Crocinitomix sp.]|nr:carboxylesterase family protein [Crocinitomix sp.]